MFLRTSSHCPGKSLSWSTTATMPAQWTCWSRANLVGTQRNSTMPCSSGRDPSAPTGTSVLDWTHCAEFVFDTIRHVHAKKVVVDGCCSCRAFRFIGNFRVVEVPDICHVFQPWLILVQIVRCAIVKSLFNLRSTYTKSNRSVNAETLQVSQDVIPKHWDLCYRKNKFQPSPNKWGFKKHISLQFAIQNAVFFFFQVLFDGAMDSGDSLLWSQWHWISVRPGMVDSGPI